MRSLALLLAAPLLAGCIFGHCPPTDAGSWRQPGLHRALLDAGWTGETRAPPEGFPVEDEALRARLGEATLGLVAYSPSVESTGRDRTDVGATLAFAPRPTLRIMAPATMTEDEVRALFRAFVRNVSAAPEKWDAWEETLVAAREPVGFMMDAQNKPTPVTYEHGVEVSGPYRLGALIAELGGLDAFAPGDFVVPGQADLSRGGWRLGLHVPVRAYEVETEDGPMRIDVDTLDQARVHFAREEGTGDPQRTLALLQGVFERAGVPPANLTRERIMTAVC